MMVRTAIVFVLSLGAFAHPGYACSVERILRPIALVSRAEVIVRVRAQAESPDARPVGFLPGGSPQVLFLVLEVLKGTSPGRTIEVSGSLTEQDDPNDRRVPSTALTEDVPPVMWKCLAACSMWRSFV
jgi:hypothetical protein